jgi:hypothetical protein
MVGRDERCGRCGAPGPLQSDLRLNSTLGVDLEHIGMRGLERVREESSRLRGSRRLARIGSSQGRQSLNASFSSRRPLEVWSGGTPPFLASWGMSGSVDDRSVPTFLTEFRTMLPDLQFERDMRLLKASRASCVSNGKSRVR